MGLERTSARPKRENGDALTERLSGPVQLRRLSARVSAELGVHTPADLCSNADLIDPERITKVKRLSKSSYAAVDLALLRRKSQPPDAPGGTKVAVKRLRQAAYTERDVTMFAREAELLVELRKNSNIPHLIGIGSDHKSSVLRWPSMFLVMEYASAGTLMDLLVAQMERPQATVYTYPEAIKWARQIAAGVATLHHHNPMIIHRDIRAENVLLFRPKDQPLKLVAKLGDFGMHMRTTPGTQLPYDEHGVYNGVEETANYCYLPPEVLRHESYDESVDMFSLGVVLYELFMRRSLVHYFSLDRVMKMTASDYADQMQSGYRMPLADKLPKELKQVIETCMDGEPAERPTIDYVVEQLRLIDESGALSVTDKVLPGCACSVM